MVYCQESHLGTCLGTVFCRCARCGIELCQQHSYFCRGEYLCFNCYVATEGISPEEICYICRARGTDIALVVCGSCRNLICTDCLVLYAIELKNPGDDLGHFDESGNDVRKWCQPCVNKYEHP